MSKVSKFCFNANVVDYKRHMDQLISIGLVDASDTLGSSLHYAAYHGKKSVLKKALDKGIHVDYPNDEGQTPLFTASYGGHERVVNYLLSAGADANEKTNLGLTAIHAACFSGHLKIVMKLLQSGGDLRLHDYQGRSAKDWAILNPNPKKRMKILEFLDKTRMFAMSSSGQDLLLNKASSKTLHRAHHRRNTVTNIIRNKIGKPSIHGNLEKMATSQHTLGFGHVYSHGHEASGFMSAIPFVNENNLKHDQNGETFDNGAFCVMESVWWDYTKVTAKKLRDDIDPYQGGVVDLLINEIEHIGKLRHPNILTLMGVCQASNLDGLYLIYETIPVGSLFNFLHQQLRRLPTEMVQKIALQICDAIIFIHLRGLVHCSISSHAISIVNPHYFKLGNFEYVLELSKCEWGKKNAIIGNTAENAVYNWMAPEVMMAMPPSFYCDMYSFCAVLWEMINGDVPWANECAESIKSSYTKGKGLKIIHSKIVEYFRIILEYGLQQEPTNRKMTFLHVRDLLAAAPKDARNYMRTRLKHLHYSDDDNDPSGSRLDRQDDVLHKHQTFEQHQGSTSKTIDSFMTKGQMRDRGKYSNRREMNRYDHQNRQEYQNNHEYHKTQEYQNMQNYQTQPELINKYEHQNKQEIRKKQENLKMQEHQNKQPLQNESERTDLIHRNPERQHYDDRRTAAEFNCRQRNRSGNRNDTMQPTQQLTYCADGLKWGNFPEEVGEEYIYTVQVKKEESPKKPSAPVLNMSSDENKMTKYESATKYLEFTESETSQENTSSTGISTEITSSDSSQYARGRELDRMTSSMGNFSYLTLGNHQRSRSAGAKPACHGHYELVAEEYTTQGKLTTAGSLYSLYNDHSPDKPLGQIESQVDHGHYSTFPRRACLVKPSVELESTPDGVNKSVRDLTKLFQQQIAEHSHYQAVLDGTVNRDHSTEKLDHIKDKRCTPYKDNSCNNDFGNHACTPQNHDVLSGWDDGKENEATADHPITESDSSSAFSTSGSSESECVSKWVDHELHKIKRKLSEEMVQAKSYDTAQSPVLFSSPDDVGYEIDKPVERKQANKLYFSDSECSDTNIESAENGHILRCNGDHNEVNIEEGFFDDELYLGTSKEIKMKSSGAFSQSLTSCMKSNLPMTTVMKKTESPSKTMISVAGTTNTEQSKNKIRRIPRRIPQSSSQLTSKPSSNEGKYANVMTIRSSLDEAGKHHVTHKIKNLKTGGSSTLLNERVTGQRVVAVFKA